MKKTILALIVACAAALGVRSAFATNAVWFAAVNGPFGGDVQTTNQLINAAQGGAWDLPAVEGISVTNNALVIEELETNVTFNADYAKAPDSNTVTRVSINAVFTSCALSDLELPTNGVTEVGQLPQVSVAFAYDEDHEELGTNFCVWTGGDYWHTISNANCLAEEADRLIIDIDYKFANVEGSNTVARFYLLKGETEYLLGETVTTVVEGDTEDDEPTITTTTVTDFVLTNKLEKLNSVGFTGSGVISNVDASVALAVATVGDVRYDNYEQAMKEAERLGVPLVTDPSRTDPNQKITRTVTGGGIVSISAEWMAKKGLKTSQVETVGENGVTNWVSYVLGLDPTNATSKVKVIPARDGDTSSENITLNLKTTIQSDAGYTVTWRRMVKVGNGEWTQDATGLETPVIPVSDASGKRYRFDAILTPVEKKED